MPSSLLARLSPKTRVAASTQAFRARRAIRFIAGDATRRVGTSAPLVNRCAVNVWSLWSLPFKAEATQAIAAMWAVGGPTCQTRLEATAPRRHLPIGSTRSPKYMVSLMRCGRHQFEITQSIVAFIPVLVMNALAPQQGAAEMRRHHPAMLQLLRLAVPGVEIHIPSAPIDGCHDLNLQRWRRKGKA